MIDRRDKKVLSSIIKAERELIYLLLHHRNIVSDFTDKGIPKNNFTEDHQLIVGTIIDVHNDSNVLLTRKHFQEKIKQFRVPKERIALELSFDTCNAAVTSEDDFPVLLNKIVEYNIQISLNNALAILSERQKVIGRVQSIRELMDNLQSILDGSSFNSERPYYEDMRILSKEKIQYLRDVRDGKIEEIPPILCGIKEIDETMVTGFEKGTLTLFCADVGVFKSTMMLNIGLNVWKAGYNVLFVPLEMHRDQMWRRACARESRISAEFLTRDIKKLTNEQFEKIEKMSASWDNEKTKFFIMQEPKYTTVSKIKRQIEKNIERMKPHLVVIDYVANLKPDNARGDRNDLEIGDMLKDMRQMGKDLGFAVVSGAQLGREALKRLRKAGANRDKPTINSEDIRGSHEYSADADNIYAQLKSISQPNELLDLYVVKARNGRTYFENGKIRATLEVYPEMGLIKSATDFSDMPIDEELENMMNDVEIEKKVITKESLFNEDKEWDEIISINNEKTFEDQVDDVTNTIEDINNTTSSIDDDGFDFSK